MANDRVDAAKVSQELSSATDANSLHSAMTDLKKLQITDATADPDQTKGVFQKDLDQINSSVDMKKFKLDGFKIAGYVDSQVDNTAWLAVQKGDETKGIDDKGGIWNQVVKPDGHHALKETGETIFASAAAPALDAAPGQKVVDNGGTVDKATPAPDARVADNGTKTDDTAPAATDNKFGTRQFQVGDDGKAFYPAKHGDTYWSVAKDLLAKPDQPDYKPSATEIANEVNKLARFNNKDNPNHLMVGEKILLPITPPAPAPVSEAAPAPAAPAAKVEVAPGTPTTAAKTEVDPKAPVTAAKTELNPKAPTPAAPPAASAAVVGFDMKAHGAEIAPNGNSYFPLSPEGLTGGGVDTTKATVDTTKPAVVADGVSTQETDMHLNDGWFNSSFRATQVTNVDKMKGDILQSRVTTYTSGVDMAFESLDAPKALTGVTKVDTEIQQDGNYKTVVTTGDGEKTFTTDAQGKVQSFSDADGNVAYAAPASSALLASLETKATQAQIAAIEPSALNAGAEVASVTPAPPAAAVDQTAEVAPATPDPTAPQRQDVADAGNTTGKPVVIVP